MPASWQVSGFFGDPCSVCLVSFFRPRGLRPPPAGHNSRELHRSGNTGGARDTLHYHSSRTTSPFS